MNRELLQQALYLIKSWQRGADAHDYFEIDGVITALEAELAKPEQTAGKCGCGANLYIDENGKPCSKAKPEQEPVAYMSTFEKDSAFDKFRFTKSDFYPIPVYTSPPRKEWVGLTDEELSHIKDYENGFWFNAKAIEAKLKEKNDAV